MHSTTHVHAKEAEEGEEGNLHQAGHVDATLDDDGGDKEHRRAKGVAALCQRKRAGTGLVGRGERTEEVRAGKEDVSPFCRGCMYASERGLSLSHTRTHAHTCAHTHAHAHLHSNPHHFLPNTPEHAKDERVCTGVLRKGLKDNRVAGEAHLMGQAWESGFVSLDNHVERQRINRERENKEEKRVRWMDTERGEEGRPHLHNDKAGKDQPQGRTAGGHPVWESGEATRKKKKKKRERERTEKRRKMTPVHVVHTTYTQLVPLA